MVKRNGLVITGGILEIIGGAWILVNMYLIYSATQVLDVKISFDSPFVYIVLISLAMVIGGVMYLAKNEIKKQNLISSGVTCLICVVASFLIKNINLLIGIVPIILIAISGLLLICGACKKDDTTNYSEPNKNE